MAVDTYQELAEQMRADAFEFATDMRARSAMYMPCYTDAVHEEKYGFRDSYEHLSVISIWVVRKQTNYAGEPLAKRCYYLRDKMDNGNRFTEGRHLKLPIELTLSQMALDRALEDREIAIRWDDADFGIVTNHTHGAADSRRRVTTEGYMHPGHYLGDEAHYDTPKVVRATYDMWRADLAAITAPNKTGATA